MKCGRVLNFVRYGQGSPSPTRYNENTKALLIYYSRSLEADFMCSSFLYFFLISFVFFLSFLILQKKKKRKLPKKQQQQKHDFQELLSDG